MALESIGTTDAKMVDLAFQLIHGMIKDEMEMMGPNFSIDKIANWATGKNGQWKVLPSILDGKPAVEIRIAVG